MQVPPAARRTHTHTYPHSPDPANLLLQDTHTHTHTYPHSPDPANLLLQDTVERIHVGQQYGDIPRGIYLVRGENVALCGEIVSTHV